MRKKILNLSFFIICLILTVGCTNSSSQNNLSLTPLDKAEVVVKSEYVSRIKRLLEATIRNDVYVSLNANDRAEKEDDYDKVYLESTVLEEQFFGGDRDRFKDFVIGLSTFRTSDEEINNLHDKLIEVSLDVYSMLDENIELGIEAEGLDIFEEKERLDVIDERQDALEDMIDNQREHAGNILTEVFDILGVDY